MEPSSYPPRTAKREQTEKVPFQGATGRLEQGRWLCPFDNLRKKGSSREGMPENLSLGSYLLLVDWTSRLFRSGKTRVSAQVAGILDRLGTSAGFWQSRLKQWLGKSRLRGSYFASSRERLRRIAIRCGVLPVDNAIPLAASG